VVRALRAIWTAAGYPWSRRLKALVPTWLPWARRRLAVSAATEAKVRAISARQIDRLLAPDKRTIRRRLYGRTKPGTLLKHHIPVKTDHWNVTAPGFTEVDLVSHSGDRADGDFLHTLNLTDIHTTWVEHGAVMGKSQRRSASWPARGRRVGRTARARRRGHVVASRRDGSAPHRHGRHGADHLRRRARPAAARADLLSLPLLMWPVFRFGPGGTSAAVFVVLSIGLWYASHGQGPLAIGGGAERTRLARENVLLVAKLQQALAEVKTLQGFIPICAWCHKVRDDAGFWEQIEQYLAKRTDATFSHSICPACAELAAHELRPIEDARYAAGA
jgi:hypothetical protein